MNEQPTEQTERPDSLEVEGASVLSLSQQRYYASDQCEQARRALEQMMHSPAYNTDSSYFHDDAYDFVERHLNYLSTHPPLNLDGYLSNLRLMTSVKRS